MLPIELLKREVNLAALDTAVTVGGYTEVGMLAFDSVRAGVVPALKAVRGEKAIVCALLRT